MRNAKTPFSFNQFSAATLAISAQIFKFIPPVSLSPEKSLREMQRDLILSLYPEGKLFQSTQGGLPTITSNLPILAVVRKFVIILAHIPSQLFHSSSTNSTDNSCNLSIILSVRSSLSTRDINIL